MGRLIGLTFGGKKPKEEGAKANGDHRRKAPGAKRGTGDQRELQPGDEPAE